MLSHVYFVRPRRAALFLLLAAMCLAGGCFRPPQPYLTPDRLEKGLVLVLTGIEGRSPFNEDICLGLKIGGVEAGIELVDWTTHVPFNYLYNLRAEKRNRRKAEEIARRIVRYQMTYPNRPVVLVGQSGGGGMAVWVAESLPRDAQVDGLVLLAACLSPSYQLDGALRHCRRGIVNFYSPRDFVFLGAGTLLAGTMDGAHASSAGHAGFNVLAQGTGQTLYSKLFQVAWNKNMGWTGYSGTHLSSGATNFVAAYLAPFVLMRQWDESAVQRVLTGLAVAPPGAPAR